MEEGRQKKIKKIEEEIKKNIKDEIEGLSEPGIAIVWRAFFYACVEEVLKLGKEGEIEKRFIKRCRDNLHKQSLSRSDIAEDRNGLFQKLCKIWKKEVEKEIEEIESQLAELIYVLSFNEEEIKRLKKEEIIKEVIREIKKKDSKSEKVEYILTQKSFFSIWKVLSGWEMSLESGKNQVDNFIQKCTKILKIEELEDWTEITDNSKFQSIEDRDKKGLTTSQIACFSQIRCRCFFGKIILQKTMKIY